MKFYTNILRHVNMVPKTVTDLANEHNKLHIFFAILLLSSCLKQPYVD